jgi:ABC-type transport system substrate-binding protein
LLSLAAALALLLLLAPAPPAARAALQPRVLVNGTALTLPADQTPIIENGLTLVPMRAIFEALGASIAWDAQTSTVTGTKGSTVVIITLNAAEATVNGTPVSLAQPARLIGSRTYVPLRFVSEALGARVGWDGETATIRITEKHPVRGGTATLPVDGIYTSLLAYPPGTPDRVIRAIYGDGLLRHQPGSLQLEPALAVDMPTVSNDGRTYTFRLRKGITFHDGTEVTAKDFELALDLASYWSYGWPINNGVARSLTDSYAEDRYTLVLTTKEPMSHVMTLLATIPPVPSHLVRPIPIAEMPIHAFWDAPVGAGPFRFASRTETELTLERNPDFWEAKINPEVGPWLDQLRFRVVKGDRLMLLVKGEIDLYDMAQPIGVPTLLTLSSMTGHEYVRIGHAYFYFNTQRYPTNIPQVRRALSLAFDQQIVVDEMMGGQAVVPPGPLPAFHWATDPNVPPQETDLKQAVALLEEAGFMRNAEGLFEKDGQVLTVQLYFSAGSSLLESIGQLAQWSWARIGVRTEVQFLDYDLMMEKYLKTGRYNVAFGGFTIAPNPTGYLENVWTAAGIQLDAQGNAGGYNRTRYSNPQMDSLVAQLKQTIDPEEQRPLIQQAVAMLNADAPAIWVYSNRYWDFMSRRMKGVVVRNGYGVSHPEYWWVTDQP